MPSERLPAVALCAACDWTATHEGVGALTLARRVAQRHATREGHEVVVARGAGPAEHLFPKARGGRAPRQPGRGRKADA